MFELSPDETAMNASASLIPASSSSVAVETETHDLPGALAGRVAPERLRVLVDDGDVVPALEQRVRKLGADPAATHDQDAHRRRRVPLGLHR